ncbi:uncharacterized protein LOC123267171 isoform X2 [Cotesia glomerata]|uniref:uncharacterized protein LOC123267171 isoform X2 n=1 Tax=Cotesia glomerata TaxID=32391 RepID=UPI001D005468|nr:uncharacterized protein LOC123267171 isoform X2 [Cotesia glomerata]
MDVTFPSEIWLEIFKWIKLPKLMELRLVCRLFYHLIEYNLDETQEWRSLAYKTLYDDCLYTTMQRAFPYHIVTEKDHPILWRRTYLSSKKWKKVMENEHKKDSIILVSSCSKISCIRTFDDEVLIVTVGQDNGLKFWDLQNKKEIVTTGFYANCINSGECRHFCIGEWDGILTSYEKIDNQITTGSKCDLRLNTNEKILNHATNGISMAALAYHDYKMKIYHYCAKLEGKRLIGFNVTYESSEVDVPERLLSSLHEILILTNTIYFIVADEKIVTTHLIRPKWYNFNSTEYFKCRVRSIALHAQILMFGLEDGSIHLLHITCYYDLMKLGKRIRHSRKIMVDIIPIINLTILEVDEKPCIVATTDRRVHLINFF